MHDMENDRKCTSRKMTEKSQQENNRMENAHPENGRKITPGNWQKKHTWKTKEWKMHDMENDRKCASRKMIQNAHLRKCQKSHNRKMIEWKMHIWEKAEKSHLE